MIFCFLQFFEGITYNYLKNKYLHIFTPIISHNIKKINLIVLFLLLLFHFQKLLAVSWLVFAFSKDIWWLLVYCWIFNSNKTLAFVCSFFYVLASGFISVLLYKFMLMRQIQIRNEAKLNFWITGKYVIIPFRHIK